MRGFMPVHRYGSVVAVRLASKRVWFRTYVTVQIRCELFTAKTPTSDFMANGVSEWLDVSPTDIPTLTNIQKFLDRQVIREI